MTEPRRARLEALLFHSRYTALIPISEDDKLSDLEPISSTGTSEKTAGINRPGLKAYIETWQENRRNYIHEQIAAASAAESRKRYRAAREAEGKMVRGYKRHNHLPQQPHETCRDYELRCHRERQQVYRTDADALKRPRADLSKMTEEERRTHVRELANARKRRERAKPQLAVGNGDVPAPSNSGDIEWGMF